MILFDGQEEPMALDALLVTAISGAQKLGLHRLGDAKIKPSTLPNSSSENSSSISPEPSHIRMEIGVRLWWALVMRDWSRGQELGYYSISPSQFNTRMPLHINDNDLCPETTNVGTDGHILARPLSEFTTLSYTVHALQIAILARESVDLRSRQISAESTEETNEYSKIRSHLNRKYEDFITGLPSYFRLGSTVGLTSTDYMAAVPVQRWMLHQQLWSLYLRLHRTNLSSQDSRATCQLLAQNIISTQTQIQARCTVCGSLSSNENQLFSAAIVLLIDLISSSSHEDAHRSFSQLSRVMIRDKIREAMDLLSGRNGEQSSTYIQTSQSKKVISTQRSVTALEALIKLEKEQCGDDEEINGGYPDSSAKKSVRDRVTKIVLALRSDIEVTTTVPDLASSNSVPSIDNSIAPLPINSCGFPELDVLPGLSNDPSSDIWRFLDFTPQYFPGDDFLLSATAGLPNFARSEPFSPP
ncbi:MAG: hypothetical protein Q9227_007176 [Pyrenula ochraceoflavens]